MTHINAFRQHFRLANTAELEPIAIAINATNQSYEIACEYLGDFDSEMPSDGMRIHSFRNLLSRIQEQLHGMLVAIATGSPASAETLGRTVVEGSINLMYLSAKGDAGTLIGYFRSWLTEHQRKLIEWKEKIATRPYVSEVSARIAVRQGTVNDLASVLQTMEMSWCIPASGRTPLPWPKALYARFEALGKETDYYETYHRLSGSSHLSGEDTLTWLVTLLCVPDKMQQLAEEAVAYSLMMTYVACGFFVDACQACVRAYGREENADLIGWREALNVEVYKLGPAAGVPEVHSSAAAGS